MLYSVTERKMASDNTIMRGFTSKLILAAAWGATTAQAFWGGNTAIVPPQTNTDPSVHKFTLRHIVRHNSTIKFYNVSEPVVKAANLKTQDDEEENGIGPYTIKSSTSKIERLVQRTIPDVQDLLTEASWFGRAPVLPQSAWTLDEVPSPNATDRDTVINFALMAANAYNAEKKIGDWEDPTPPFNHSSAFGWKGDSLRGHVFANQDNSTIVLSIKGTSPALWDGIETTTNDKINDNLFFSCCCGQGGQYLWVKVCDCMTSSYTCNQTCVVETLKQPKHYYSQVIELYGNVTEYYPDSNVWLTGHSLGGSTASLLGLTFGIPVLTFEAVPDALPASRLGLPVPPGNSVGTHQQRRYTGAYHFGHSADPVFMGTCNGASFCTVGGYAMQSQCHTGHKCMWDTVGDKKWRQSLTYHGIRSCISDVYRGYDHLPQCEHDSECADCAIWKFYESNHTESTTTTKQPTSTNTATRTETCKTPGWWGCKDGSTTTTTTTSTSTGVITTSTTTVVTETCKSYGWFGRCLDSKPTTTTFTSRIPITITTTVALTSISTPSATQEPTACETPGFFWGCRDDDEDETTQTRRASATLSRSSALQISNPTGTSSTCTVPGILWGCRDTAMGPVATETTAARDSSMTPAPHMGL